MSFKIDENRYYLIFEQLSLEKFFRNVLLARIPFF